MTKYPRAIGDVIREKRRAKGMSQLKLAVGASLDLKTISLIERNHQEPRLSTLYSLADALGIEFIELMKEIHRRIKTYP